MDSGTHIVMGVTLGALATLDPGIGISDTAILGVTIATVLGSKAPDIDTVFKLHNNARYIQHHRGPTHSVPAVLFWTLLISFSVHLFFSDMSYFHLLLWTFIAVFLHVFTDIFNAYGTQALRPFSNKWIALGVIGTFDPALFTIHATAIALFFLLPTPSGVIALWAYGLSIFYYFIRLFMHYRLKAKIRILIPGARVINITPSIHLLKYHVAVITKDTSYIVKVNGKHMKIVDTFKQQPLPHTPVIEAALKDQNVISFLTFSPHFRYNITKFDTYTEVRFMDLRYYSGDRYPFVAIVKLDSSLNILSSFTGWVFKEEKLQKKLGHKLK
ncbi:MAG: metal-dependent hydrolase [Bacilli bacterium]